MGRSRGEGPPVADRAMLFRHRLVERLGRRWQVPVTVVTAPAGYGKTTLLAQALAAGRPSPEGVDLWVPGRRGAATAASLGERLRRAAGARPARPGAGPDDPDGVVAAVTEALWGRAPDHVALVLDDAHEVAPGSPAARLLAAVVAELPDNGHVVLAGRWPPPVPIGRLLVEGRAIHLGEGDLSFTDDELAAFAALRGVPPAKVAGCGGWPALAELQANDLSGFADDYVGEEVLAPLGAERRRHVALLAHLGTFDRGVARAVLGAGVDVDAVLAGLPLVATTDDGRRRLHALWRDLVGGTLAPTEVAGARRRAATALAGDGRVAEAVELLLEAGEEPAGAGGPGLEDALVGVLDAAHPPVSREVLAEWLDRLPAGTRGAPAGRLLAAVVAAEADPAGARGDLAACAAAFRRAGDARGEAASLAQLGRLAWWSEDPAGVASTLGRIGDLAAGGYPAAVPLARLGWAVHAMTRNAHREALAALDRIPPGSLAATWRAEAEWLRAVSYLQLGDTGAALAAADRAFAHADPPHAPVVESTRDEALWLQGAGDEVLARQPGVLDRMRRAGARNALALMAGKCALGYALHGRTDAAADTLAVARGAATAPPPPVIATMVAVADAALAVAGGDEARAGDALAACVARHPLGSGLSALAQHRGLALLYVLVPGTRAWWQAEELGPAFEVARRLAEALVGVRDGGRLPAGTPPLGPGIVRAHLPVPWAAELGVAAVAAGRDDGWALLEATWPDAQPAVARLAGARSGRPAAEPLRRAAASVPARLPVPPSAPLELRLLGPTELRRAGALVTAPDWRRERVRSLLAYLALHGTVQRERVAEDLWPALDAEAQARNLRVTLSYLLRVLEPGRGRRDASFFVRQHGTGLGLHRGRWLTVDVDEFDAHCAAADDAERQGAPASALDHARRAAALWREDPVALASEPWALPLVEARRRRFAAVATRAGELVLARGGADSADEAVALAERALAADPWLERAHRLVVAAHRAGEDTLAARRAAARHRAAVGELAGQPHA
jgi:DNA-binding SARP family transcriptional activator